MLGLLAAYVLNMRTGPRGAGSACLLFIHCRRLYSCCTIRRSLTETKGNLAFMFESLTGPTALIKQAFVWFHPSLSLFVCVCVAWGSLTLELDCGRSRSTSCGQNKCKTWLFATNKSTNRHWLCLCLYKRSRSDQSTNQRREELRPCGQHVLRV